jgi:hypothetical protein
MAGVIGGKRLGEDRRSTIKQGDFCGAGGEQKMIRIKGLRLRYLYPFWAIKQSFGGVFLAEIKNQKNVNSALPET